jgi:5,6,7,8-tetrahydromethanopterin hydro-lyase
MMQLGEAFVGSGPESAHINTVLGHREGPVGTAWATALATPREGHAAFVVVAQPNMPVKPFTLFVNKATITTESHGRLHYGAAQLGVASGVLEAVSREIIDADLVDNGVLIVAVWVAPAAENEDLVFENNRAAVHQALENGAKGDPSISDLLAIRDQPFNSYFIPKK